MKLTFEEAVQRRVSKFDGSVAALRAILEDMDWTNDSAPQVRQLKADIDQHIHVIFSIKQLKDKV